MASYPAEGGGWAHEVELRYATFVEYQSRPTMPRFDLAPLAKTLNAIDDRLAAEQRWEVAGITDTGPLLRVNDGARRLTKAERYGSPDERPMIGSGFTPERFREIVRSYFDHGVRGAMKHLRVKRPEDVPRVGFWSWTETRAANQTVDWTAWVPPGEEYFRAKIHHQTHPRLLATTTPVHPSHPLLGPPLVIPNRGSPP